MKYYSYHPETQEFVGQGDCAPNPLEPKSWLLPANATFDSPPQTGANEVAIYSVKKSQWVITPDYRGKTYWDTETKEQHEIKELGIAPLSTWTDKEPNDSESIWLGDEWTLPFDVLHQRKINMIIVESNVELQTLKENVGQADLESWTKEESGANQLALDLESKESCAVYVRALATIRGESTESLVAKIQKNVEKYNAELAKIVAKKQARLKQAQEAETAEQLTQI